MKSAPDIDLAHEVIQSIVTLTEQRDQRSLEQSLLATLSEMLENVEGWLLDTPAEDEKSDEFILLHGIEATLPPQILDIGRGLPQTDGIDLIDLDGRAYLLAKLQDAERDRPHLLVLAQAAWPEAERKVALAMIRVYQNFVGLLYDSEKDTLTGLYNRRKLETKLKDYDAAHPQGRRQKDQGHGNYLAIMDLDRFKSINDNYGHLIGDEVLLTFANILRRTLRDRDLIFRYGGEEFVVLLQETANDSIDEVLERVRRNVEAHDFPLVGKVTVSIGFALLDGTSSPLDVLERADRAMYYAKDNGRNQVHEFGELVKRQLLQDIQRDGGVELF